jgi:hypothetical protein
MKGKMEPRWSGLLSGLLLLVLPTSTLLSMFEPFQNARPKVTESRLYEIPAGLAGVAGQLAAFADVNGDRFVDIILMHRSPQSPLLTGLLWNHATYAFEHVPLLNRTGNSHTAQCIPARVLVSDLNSDGALDILVLCYADNSLAAGAAQVDMYVHLGDTKHFDQIGALIARASSSPFVSDFNNDLRADFMGLSDPDDDDLTIWASLRVPRNPPERTSANVSSGAFGASYERHALHDALFAALEIKGRTRRRCLRNLAARARRRSLARSTHAPCSLRLSRAMQCLACRRVYNSNQRKGAL